MQTTNNSTFTLILALLFFVVLSCRKDDEPDAKVPCVEVESNFSQDTSFYVYEKGSQEFGWARGVKNNKIWEASAQAIVKEDKILLWFRTFLVPHLMYDTEYFEFDGIPQEVGCFEVYTSCEQVVDSEKCVKSLFLALDDDVIEDYYNVHEASTLHNILEIVSIDLVSKRLKGKISVSYEVRDGRSNKEYNPTLVRIFNVQFDCAITE